MKNESLKSLKGIGDKTERLFQKAGICDLEQLLRYYPERMTVMRARQP